MGAYYNEHDPFAAAWLRELIQANLIAPGEVDERSIEDVKPDDLKGFTQCHFFAGIGVWSYALRNAGWPDDSPVWTGSCPCQGFSSSGKRGGFSDKRHLWPAWFRLIKKCRPHTIFGEQVASKDGLAWLDVVSADLEGKGYALGAADICAAGVGAPHIRQRLFFVADSLKLESRNRELQRSGRLGRAEEDAAVSVRDVRPRDIGRFLTTNDSGYGGRCAAFAICIRPAARVGHFGCAVCEECFQYGCRTYGMGVAGASRSSNGKSEELRGTRRKEERRATSESGEALGKLGDPARRGFAMCGSESGSSEQLAQSGKSLRMDHAFSHGRRTLRDHDGSNERLILHPASESGRMVHPTEDRCRDGLHLAGNHARSHESQPEHQYSDSGHRYSEPANQLANPNGGGCGVSRQAQSTQRLGDSVDVGRGPTNGFWRDAEWRYCRDGKYRPTKPGTPVLATGVTNRVGKLRGYGNSIVAPVAQAFIEAFMSLQYDS